MAGPLGYFVYTTDGGGTVIIQMDASNAAAVNNDAATAATEPSADAAEALALREYRYILAESATGERRKIIVCDPEEPLYTAGGTVNLQVVGAAPAAFRITGTVGEKKSFPVLPAA